MKTAGRENPNHGATLPHNRAHGAVGQNRFRSIRGAVKQEKFRPRERCFFLTLPFIELIRRWELPTLISPSQRILSNALSVGPDQVHNGVMTVIFASWCGTSQPNISSEHRKHREHPGAGYTQDSAPFFIPSFDVRTWIPAEKWRYRSIGSW